MIGLLGLIGAALAAQVVLDADAKRLEVGEQTQLRVAVVGDRADQVPQIPAVDGLRVSYLGEAQSLVSVNMRSQRMVTYTYTATALREGAPRIPPVDVLIDGERLQTNALNLTVTPRILDDDESFTAGFPDDQAWVGQVLVYSAELRTPARIIDSSWTPPPLDGLVIESSSQATRRDRTRVIDGKAVNEVSFEVPLVVTTPGTREIAPSVVNVQVPAKRQQRHGPMDFGFGLTEVDREVYASEPQKLEVRALPVAGRVPARWTGLVGDFELSVSLSEDQLAAGGSTTLELRLEGEGSLAGFALPTASQEGYRAYDDAPELSSKVDGGHFLTKGIYRRAIVPEAPGELVLPAFSLQVFSPALGSYQDLEVPELRIEVGEGEQIGEIKSFSDAPTGGQGVASLGDDILPIHADASARSAVLKPWQPLALVLLPLLGFVGILARELRAKLAPPEDPRALLRARLQQLTGAELGELEDCFRACLGLALGLPPAGIKRASLAGLPDTLRADCEGLYTDLEAARYGGGADEGLRERVRVLGGRLCG